MKSGVWGAAAHRQGVWGDEVPHDIRRGVYSPQDTPPPQPLFLPPKAASTPMPHVTPGISNPECLRAKRWCKMVLTPLRGWQRPPDGYCPDGFSFVLVLICVYRRYAAGETKSNQNETKPKQNPAGKSRPEAGARPLEGIG